MNDLNKEKCQSEVRKPCKMVEETKVPDIYATYPNKTTSSYERRFSRTPEMELKQEKRRQSLKNEERADPEEASCHRSVSARRVSVPSNRTTPKKKSECGTHVVAKSELWDTGNQHRCPKSHQKTSRVSISQEEGNPLPIVISKLPHPTFHQNIFVSFVFFFLLEESIIHRTVSERNRHAQKREKSPKKDKDIPNICNQQCNKLGYFQSTPNVADLKGSHASQTVVKRDKSMYNATSESELLDREILPIFQKLLTERNKSQNNIDYSFGRSCPNISIKCDIVEYL